MAEFPKAILTDAGKNMIARAQMGEKLIFTKGKYGEGQLGVGDDIESFVDLKSSKLNLPIQEMSNPQNGQTTITLLIDRENLKGGFWGRELGLFAKLEEGGIEQLFCYTNAGAQADYIAKTDSVVSEFIDIDTIVGNVENLAVVIDKTKVYVTKEQLEDHDMDSNAHTNLALNILNQVGYVGKIEFPTFIVQENHVKLNGAVLSRKTYQSLWEFAENHGLVITEAEWQEIDSKTGLQLKSGLFSSGNGSTTFRLPDHRGMFYRVLDEGRGVDSISSRILGSFQGDAIRNITGTWQSRGIESWGVVATGAFYHHSNNSSRASGDTTTAATIGFDASKIVPTAAENIVKNISLFSTIQYK